MAKFRITMKDTDWYSDSSFADDAKQSLGEDVIKALMPSELESVVKARVETLKNFTSDWIEWGDYVVIEFDTEAGTATVIKVGE